MIIFLRCIISFALFNRASSYIIVPRCFIADSGSYLLIRQRRTASVIRHVSLMTKPSLNEYGDVSPSSSINNAKEDIVQAAKFYVKMMRPITISQAVGAFLVGRLVILTSDATTHSLTIQELPSIITASLSIYLSYGAGMAMNDCADVGIDSMHDEKQSRSIASNTISLRNASLFCIFLSILSMMLSFIASCNGGLGFPVWTFVNLAIMAAYALGLQRIFLVKNLICGYLAIAPLIGAALLGDGTLLLRRGVEDKLLKLAAIGFPLQVAREILKDIEDVEIDKGIKQTLPLLVGKSRSKLVAYSLVAAVNMTMLLSSSYWRMFYSTPNVYALSVAIGTPMCIRASMLELSKGQKMLKRSIYVLLLGMITALLNQAR